MPCGDGEPQRWPRATSAMTVPTRHALHAHVESKDEKRIEGDVGEIEDQLQHQRHPCPSQADEPAEQGIVRQRRGRGPDPDVVVVARQRLDLRAAVDQSEGQLADRPLERDEPGADGKGDQHRASQARADLHRVGGAKRLGGQARRAHAQEAEAPEHEVEDQRAQRYRADVRRIGNLPHHARVDDAEKRRRDTGDHDRHGDRQDRAMRDRLQPANGLRVFRHRGWIVNRSSPNTVLL